MAVCFVPSDLAVLVVCIGALPELHENMVNEFNGKLLQ
jgi:hypothetical protein